MGKSELVFTMTHVEHKAAVKVDERPDGPLVGVRLRFRAMRRGARRATRWWA